MSLKVACSVAPVLYGQRRFPGAAEVGILKPTAGGDAVDPKRHFATVNCRVANALFHHIGGDEFG